MGSENIKRKGSIKHSHTINSTESEWSKVLEKRQDINPTHKLSNKQIKRSGDKNEEKRLKGMNPLTTCQFNRTRVAAKIIKRNRVV